MLRRKALDKLEELREELPSFKNAPYDHPQFQSWRLSVESLLITHLGQDHTITTRFRQLDFRVNPMVEWNRGRDASEAEQQEEFAKDLEQANAILNAAVRVWFETAPVHNASGPGATTPGGSPLQVTLNNNNSNTSNSSNNASANASVTLGFPLEELLEMIDASTEIPEVNKPKAREVVENLDGELRKRNPRWEKVSAYLKGALGFGREIAIETIAAVLAEYTKNNIGF